MARSQSRKSGSQKRKAQTAQRKRDPEEGLFEEAMLEMVEVISCPVLVAEEQAERCAEMLMEAQQGRDLAILALDYHENTPLAQVLEELVTALDRHARELATLGARLVALRDHDVAHSHVNGNAIDLKRLARAMFGPEPGLR